MSSQIINAKKSILSPTQRITYLGFIWGLVTMWAQLCSVAYIDRQGGLHSCGLKRLAQQILFWAQNKFLSLRVIYIPGHINVGEDLQSRQPDTQGMDTLKYSNKFRKNCTMQRWTS